ncbi:alginate O-acetyltransferase AlgX-related protein [Microbacterium sp. ASV81]|uniref:AlgX/AlgJ SGNH hydrolase-like domain-containing protein n=1 Tax=Microbacterium capsulatum TaxID=3041921 RepID=A0ABU0XNP4_9MICO|nr:hypothetical protein [Microbacterium sp. ASV81]MDQ4215375.1 hypothetical protein [Microbacterium sp. ASV81]
MTGLHDVSSHGATPRAPRRWWRHAGYAPLSVLAAASVAALLLGMTTTAQQNRHTVPAVTAAPTGTAKECRPPVAAPAAQPWLSGGASAEQTWQQHSAELAKPYLVGSNGWTFWSDYIEQYASQAVGRDTLSQAQLDAWASYHKSIRDNLAAQGIEFYIEITPSTSSVYPEQLPTWMQSLRGSTILDQYLSVAGDLPVIDLRQNLIAAKTPDTHLFSWSNSHWTGYGGYVGWKQIASCVNAMHPSDKPLQVPAITGTRVIGDFNEWASFGVPSPGQDWSVPTFAHPLQDVTYTDNNQQTKTVPGDTDMDAGWLPLHTSVPNSWTGKSALIIRDSMGNALSPYWDQAYSPTVQVSHLYNSYSVWPNYRQLVDEYHPKVVIVQIAERHLINAPPPGAGY